jgi:hypothetical protein
MKHESKVKKFGGYIVLPEFLNIRQVRAFEDSLGSLDNSELDGEKRVWKSVEDEKRLPVLFAVVSEWHIEGVPEQPTLETFPMTPLGDAHDFIAWAYMLIRDLWIGEIVPNE